MNRTGVSRADEFDQYELEHAPMMQPSETPIKESHAHHVQVTEDDDFGAEPPTSKTRTSRWIILARSLILVPPIIITIVILALNFGNIFWMGPTREFNTILGALQFAAQIHGSLLVASISMMVLNLIQHGLASPKGLPLGIISSNFYTDSPSWLFRTEFRSLSLKYTLIFPFVVALTVLQAPSSAIVMIPRLQFWSVDNVWRGKDDINFGVYIQASPESLYPEIMTSAMSAPQCAGLNASVLPECPSYGSRRFLLDRELFTFPPPSSINITMPGKWNRYMIGHDGKVYRGTMGSYLTSSLSVFLGDAMLGYHNVLSSIGTQWLTGNDGKGTVQHEDKKLRARYDLSFKAGPKEILTRKPLVEAQCSGFPGNSTSLILPHGQMSGGNWALDPIASTVWTIPFANFSTLSADLNSTIVNTTFIASDADFFPASKPSLAAIFATPKIYHLDNGFEDKGPLSYFACTFNARWMVTKTYLEIAVPESTVYDSSPDPEAGFYVSEGGQDISSLPALIAGSWADLLNAPWIDSLENPEPTNRTILDIIGQQCINTHTYLNATVLRQKPIPDGDLHYVVNEVMQIYTCLQAALSAYLTDALSRAHNTVPVYIDIEGHVDKPYSEFYPKDLSISASLYADAQLLQPLFPSQHANITAAEFKNTERFTEIKMKVSRYGYGYGFQDSILVYVGVAILLLHALLSVIYIAWVVAVAKLPGNDDRTVGKLLVLGMQSGSLSSSGHDVALDGDKTSTKQMWKMRMGFKYVGEDGAGVIGDGESKKGPAILTKI
ncbi:hypothetical protein VTL71DRAFT_5466 [Oculimacula yallundae]|uniref:Uncharacterized protein n=1 Tax=Oculimacula yallundae TaxID=86028 RepID=A0ABR4C2R6_9HELO